MEIASYETENNKKAGQKVENNFQCEICHKYFGSKNILGKHIKGVHLRVKNFHCQICEISFVRNDELKSHVRKKHPKDGEVPEKFYCDQCAKQFTEKKSLNYHIKYRCARITAKNYHCDLW